MRTAGPIGCLLALAAACAADPPRPVEDTLVQIEHALRDGRIEEAAEVAASVRIRDPQHVAAAEFSADVAELTWRDDDAVRDLTAALRNCRVDGREMPGEAEVHGRLGDILFRAGRYAESIEPLREGSLARHGERRRAFAAIAQLLPAVRRADGPLVSEHPLLPGDKPEFACGTTGKQRSFVIDTGTAMTTLSVSLADELGVQSQQPAGHAVDSTGQTLPTQVGVLPDFTIGDIRLGAVPVLVIDDAAFELRDLYSDPHGGPIRMPRAVLGLDLIGACRLTLDPERKSVVLELPRGLPVEQSVQCVRVEGRCLVPVFVDDVRMWFVLDTGASRSSLAEAGLMALPGGANRAVPSEPLTVYKVGGVTKSVYEVRDLVIRCSQARFLGVTLPVVPRDPEGAFPVHGVLGIDLLGRCRVTLDRGRARLTAP
jgi:hypothetical protein